MKSERIVNIAVNVGDASAQDGAPWIFMVSDDANSHGNGTDALQIHKHHFAPLTIVWRLQPFTSAGSFVALADFQLVGEAHHLLRRGDPVLVNGFYECEVLHKGRLQVSAQIQIYNALGQSQGSFLWRPSITVA